MAIYYYQDGTTEDVHEDNVDLFLEQNPTATLEPIKAKKTNDVAEPGAAVASETTAPESGDSPSESTSSEFPTLTDQASTAEEAKAAGLDVIPGGRQEGDTIFGVTIPEVSANPLTFEEQLDEEKSELETKINNFSTNTAKAKSFR